MILGVLWLACGGGPVFSGIEEVEVKHLDPTGGLKSFRVSSAELPEFRTCLDETRKIKADELDEKLLTNAYLLAVEDAKGIRSFELLSKRNLSDGDGTYYYNGCLFSLIRKIERRY